MRRREDRRSPLDSGHSVVGIDFSGGRLQNAHRDWAYMPYARRGVAVP